MLRALPRPRLVLLLLAAALCTGCAMQRRVTIDSAPSGAEIWVNGEKQPGTTPVTIAFPQYGYWDVRLEKRGYESVATQVRVASQIDGYPIVDLPYEVFGGTRNFRRVVPMKPLETGNVEQRVEKIMQSARDLRRETHEAVAEPGTPDRQAPEFVR